MTRIYDLQLHHSQLNKVQHIIHWA